MLNRGVDVFRTCILRRSFLPIPAPLRGPCLPVSIPAMNRYVTPFLTLTLLLLLPLPLDAQILSRPDYDAAAKGWSAGLQAITGNEVVCTGGQAAGFACNQVNLLSFLPIADIGGQSGVNLNDIWGWTDPASGREFAIVGRTDGTAFVEVTDPVNPVYLGSLPLHAGAQPSIWRDMKVYANHAFIVADGAGAHGLQVFDLTRLLNVENPPVIFTEDAHYDAFGSAHNIVINEDTGFAYAVGLSSGGTTCGGGFHAIDIRDPLQPTFAGCFADYNTRRGYTHDAQCVVYHGPDAEHQGKELCFGSNEDKVSIIDMTDKALPRVIANASYPNAAYTHQGWLTEDHRYLIVDDELDELQGRTGGTRTLIWDVTDLDDPQLVSEYLAPRASIDHNQYVKGHYVFQAHYTSGLRILDIADLDVPREVAFFDTYTPGDGTGFQGAWSVYPYFPSGTIV
ncbi:MAG: choice-of-anchor B family protein, partial [Bacteroidetes bacterium]